MGNRRVRYLVVGAGMSGLSFANFVDSEDVLILERDETVGGYCKTVHQDGFVWDYSGHFFHFRHPELEAFLRERMSQASEVRTVEKDARILYKGELIDFPFQKNIHQLTKDEAVECLYDLWFRDTDAAATDFKAMLYQKFGRGIAEKFLVPYNEKLYACDLAELDVDAMGRFFPYADVGEIIANFRKSDNESYNATFTYPRGGAIEYVRALLHDIPDHAIECGTTAVHVNLEARTLETSRGETIEFEYLVSSAPFDRLLTMCELEPASSLSANKVAVFNLGFDGKGLEGVHWVYVPDPDVVFYRVGFYDNIFDTDRMSLYVEVGRATEDAVDMDALRARVLADLAATEIVTDQQLVSYHQVVLDPAYVHITADSRREVERVGKMLAARGVYSIGRYGGWTYCSIEDNMVEARGLADMFNQLHH